MKIFSKIVLSTFIIVLLTKCETKSASTANKDTEKMPCSLEDKVDKDPLKIFSYNDFTVESIRKQLKDKDGTAWSDATNDDFRFVFKNRKGWASTREGEFVVYKNGAVYKRHKNVAIDGSRTTRVDRTNCSYNPWSELELSYSDENSTIIKVASSGSGYYVWYYPDNKTLYQGEFRQFNIPSY